MRSQSILAQPSSVSAIPSQTVGSLSLLKQPSSASALPQGMRSSSSTSAAPSRSMRSSSLESYDVIPPQETAQYLAPIPEYNQPLASSYHQQPPTFVDDPFPTLEELPSLSLTDLTEVRKSLNKSIKSITGQINKAEGRRANLSPKDLGLVNYRKGYKNKLMEYKRTYFKALFQTKA